jgi:hypothetical protein
LAPDVRAYGLNSVLFEDIPSPVVKFLFDIVS